MRPSAVRLIAAVYLALVLIAGAHLAYRMVFAPDTSDLAGVPALFLTLPWSLALVLLGEILLGGGVAVGLTAIAAGALINVVLFQAAAARATRSAPKA